MQFIDGIERNRENPTTFQIPTPGDIALLTVGDLVKIGIANPGERFWVKITEIVEGQFFGEVANHLLSDDLKFRDRVTFQHRHILST